MCGVPASAHLAWLLVLVLNPFGSITPKNHSCHSGSSPSHQALVPAASRADHPSMRPLPVGTLGLLGHLTWLQLTLPLTLSCLGALPTPEHTLCFPVTSHTGLLLPRNALTFLASSAWEALSSVHREDPRLPGRRLPSSLPPGAVLGQEVLAPTCGVLGSTAARVLAWDRDSELGLPGISVESGWPCALKEAVTGSGWTGWGCSGRGSNKGCGREGSGRGPWSPMAPCGQGVCGQRCRLR